MIKGILEPTEFDLASVDVGEKKPETKGYLNIFGRGCVSLASMPLVTSLASTVMSALISCSTRLDVSVTFTGLPSLKGEGELNFPSLKGEGELNSG